MTSYVPNFERCEYVSSDTVINVDPKTRSLIFAEKFPSCTVRSYEIPFTFPFAITKGIFHDHKATSTDYLEFTNIHIPYLKRRDRESVYLPVSSRIGLLCSRILKDDNYGILFGHEIKSFIERAKLTTIKRLRIPLFVVEKWYVEGINKSHRSKVLKHLHYEDTFSIPFHMKGKGDVEELVFNHPFSLCVMAPNPLFPSDMVTMEQTIITEKKIVCG